MLKSLCFMRLKKAGVIIGLHDLVGCFVVTVALLYILEDPDVIIKRYIENMRETYPIVYEQIHIYDVVFILRVALGLFVFHMLASGLLIWGTIKERHLMLLPFLTSYGVGVLFLFLFLFFFVLGAFIGSIPLPISMQLGYLLFDLFGLALQSYIFCGVFSLFKQIKLKREERSHLIELQVDSSWMSQTPNPTTLKS